MEELSSFFFGEWKNWAVGDGGSKVGCEGKSGYNIDNIICM